MNYGSFQLSVIQSNYIKNLTPDEHVAVDV